MLYKILGWCMIRPTLLEELFKKQFSKANLQNTSCKPLLFPWLFREIK